MMKRLAVLCVVMLCSFAFVHAQDATAVPADSGATLVPTAEAVIVPAANEPIIVGPERRELFTLLDWGDRAFEPSIWLASGQEDLPRTTALWRADGLGGLGYATLLHFEDGIALNQIPAVFNDQWFQTTLSNYAVWREDRRCELGNVKLFEFGLQNNNVQYTMRYWVEWRSDTRVLAFFLVFPSADALNLDTYSARLYPDLSSCVGAVG